MATISSWSLELAPLLAQSSPGQRQTITVNDPSYGIPEGKLSFFAGWHGRATVDHSDALSDYRGVTDLYMTSPDGSETIQLLGRPFHTADPFLHAMAAANPGVVLTRFHSTGDLLTRYIVPAFHLGGQVSSAEPFAQDTVAKIRGGSAGPGAFSDAAAVTIKNVGGGKEIFLWGITVGQNGGTSHETSKTFIQMVTAPAGKAQALAASYRALPLIQFNPEWQQREGEEEQKVAKMTREQVLQYNQRQYEMNVQNKRSMDSARERQQANFDRNSTEIQWQQQASLDGANLMKTTRAGLYSSFHWCNAQTGDERVVVDSLDSPGAGYERCPTHDR